VFNSETFQNIFVGQLLFKKKDLKRILGHNCFFPFHYCTLFLLNCIVCFLLIRFGTTANGARATAKTATTAGKQT
jgi:hypothetical protein